MRKNTVAPAGLVRRRLKSTTPSTRRLAASLCISLAGLSTSGCSLWNPYLDSTALNKTACAESHGCSVEARFENTRDVVIRAQKEAHAGVTDRAYVDTISSAAAFPAAGYLLFRGTSSGGSLSTVQQRQLLGAGLSLAALYETRAALLSGTPEGIYLLADARLGCVAIEADRYALDFPQQSTFSEQARLAEHIACDTKRDAVQAALGAARPLQQSNLTLPTAFAQMLPDVLAAAQKALDDYQSTPGSLQDAIYAMRSAAMKIVSDTNGQLKLPGATVATATPLLQAPLTQVTPVSTPAPIGVKDASEAAAATRTVNDLSVATTAFVGRCLRPHPVNSTGFASCTTYSPAAAPVSAVTTSLTGNSATLAPGKSLAFLATSSPTGQPWATVLGDTATAQASIGQLQQRTVTPNQTQVTVNYTTAVAADTPLMLSIAPTNGSAAATIVTVTLLANSPAPAPAPAPTPASAPAPAPPAPAANGLQLDGTQRAKIMAIDPSSIPAFKNAGDLDSRIEALSTSWRAQCEPAAGVNPTAAQLTDSGFLNSLMTPPPSPPAPRSWCPAAN